MGFNPADYAAVENTAKSMSKPELEKYYVERKNYGHTSLLDTIGCIFIVIIMVFAIGTLGYLFATENFIDDMQEVLEVIANEVCPVSDSIYVSVDLESRVSDLVIDCSTYRHK